MPKINRNTISDFEIFLYVWDSAKSKWNKKRTIKRTPSELLTPDEKEAYILYDVSFTCAFVSVFCIPKEKGSLSA